MMMVHSHSHRDDDTITMRPRPVVHLQPNLIARLMGMDAVVPPPPKPQPQNDDDDDRDAENPGSSSSSRICLHRMMMLVPRSRSSRPSSRQRRGRRRRHPQEEELLQKMKRDLQAWQASRAPALQTTRRRPSDSDSDSGGGGGRSTSLALQAIAQEELRRHKMPRYDEQQVELPLTLNKTKNNKKNGGVEQGEAGGHEHAAAAAAPGAQPAQALTSQRHTPIVLLKPATTCSESDAAATGGGGGGQKTLFLGLPKLHRDAGMSLLLQEVKDRVQRELTLHVATTTTPATGGELIKAPTTWAIPPLQQVSKQDRGSKRRLFRSESFRAFRRDRRRNASPEEYIVKSETAMSPEEKGDDEQDESLTDASSLSSVLRPGVVVGVTDGPQSFRSECLTTLTKHRDDDAAPASPRRLFRSFSAPESGLSFSLGRLLPLFTSKQHEASEPAAAAAAVTSKNVVSAGLSFIRGAVLSSLSHGFSSRRNPLFRRGRKTHWYNKTSVGAAEIHPANKMEVPSCTATPPPSHETFSLFNVAQANLSELPPSPVSPLEVAAGHSSRHFFTDLHFALPPPELSPKCVSEFEAPATVSESSFRTDITAVVETACSRDKAYITEVLIAAGLYYDDDGPSASANARVDSMARPMPICDDVFEDVEDLYYYRGGYIVGGGMYDDHRMLFDLAKEALQSLVAESSRGGSSLRQWVVDSTGVARGKKLVDQVCYKVQALRNNPQAAQGMQTIEGMVAYEARRCVWAEELLYLYEDVYAIGRKIERAIFDELIQDLFACANDEGEPRYSY